MNRLIPALVILALAAPAWAQDDDAAALPDPALAPPTPPNLSLDAARPDPPPPPTPPMPPGAEPLPGGGLRLHLTGDTLDPAAQYMLQEVGRRLAQIPLGRITVESRVSGPANDVSAARRTALARARVVKTALVAGGLDPTRIDLRPLGRTDPPADTLDVLPPAALRAAAQPGGG